MIWLTWRQFRAQAGVLLALLAALAIVLAVTGRGVARDYAAGLATCTPTGNCSDFLQRFFQDHQDGFLGVTAVVLVLPALLGLFWGAPLITRELEAGTHRLVWNQSITRTRWLAVKLGLTGLVTIAAPGLVSLAVSWWSDPIDQTAADFPRLGPLVFAARGIVPIGYAAFAFVLGVTVGMLVRRTLPAMAITLAVFVALQVAMPLLVRPHLIPPVEATFEIGRGNLDGLSGTEGSSGFTVHLDSRVASDIGAWVLSSKAVDASGNPAGTVSLSRTDGPCAPGRGGMDKCLAEINRLGYRQQVSYHPSSRFWPFQWIETGIYTVLTLALAGLGFWRIRRRLS